MKTRAFMMRAPMAASPPPDKLYDPFTYSGASCRVRETGLGAKGEADGLARIGHVRRAVRLGKPIFRLERSGRKGPDGTVHRLHPRRHLRLQEQGLSRPF